LEHQILRTRDVREPGVEEGHGQVPHGHHGFDERPDRTRRPGDGIHEPEGRQSVSKVVRDFATSPDQRDRGGTDEGQDPGTIECPVQGGIYVQPVD
jgi:hypothetical protein